MSEDNLEQYHKLKRFTHYVRWMQEQDLDCVGIVSAPKGFGKSTLKIQLIRMYAVEFSLACTSCGHKYYTTKQVISKQGGDFNKQSIREPCPECGSQSTTETEFDITDVLAYDNPEVRELIRDLPAFGQILADEGVRFIMAEDWNKSENKATKRQLAQMRPKHLSLWVGIQKFSWVDSKVRDDMATFWIRILNRGLAVVLEPDLGEAKDSWHLDEFRELLGHYNYRTSADELRRRADRIVEEHPCGFDMVHWPDVPDPIYDEYLKIRNEKAFQKQATSDFTQKDLAKVMAYNLHRRWDDIEQEVDGNRGGMTLRTLASEVFRHPETEESLVSPGTLSKWNSQIESES